MPRSKKFSHALEIAEQVRFSAVYRDCDECGGGCWAFWIIAATTIGGEHGHQDEGFYQHLTMTEAMSYGGMALISYANDISSRETAARLAELQPALW